MTAGAARLRPGWAMLPRELRRQVEHLLGGTYVSDLPSHAGFSANYAGVVTTTAGRGFVKAAGPDWHDGSVLSVRFEIAMLALLPTTITPAVLGTVDDSTGVALLLAPVDGRRPDAAVSSHDLSLIAAALREMVGTRAPQQLPSAAEDLAASFRRWRDIAADETLRAGLPESVESAVGRLCEMETTLSESIAGDVLVHNDLRADNLLLSADRAHLLDWPHARRGAAWIDLPGLVIDLEALGGPPCEQAWPAFEEYGAPPLGTPPADGCRGDLLPLVERCPARDPRVAWAARLPASACGGRRALVGHAPEPRASCPLTGRTLTPDRETADGTVVPP